MSISDLQPRIGEGPTCVASSQPLSVPNQKDIKDGRGSFLIDPRN